MNNNGNSSSANGGVGLFGLLTVAFVVLKLCHVIGWSWWWVLAPLWIPAAVALVVLAIFLAVGLLRSL